MSMDFVGALTALKEGKCVARGAWHDQFVCVMPISAVRDLPWRPEGIPSAPFLLLIAGPYATPWTPTDDDMLRATDWVEVLLPMAQVRP